MLSLQRYLNILLGGAREHKLKDGYIRFLEAHLFTPYPICDISTEMRTLSLQRRFTEDELVRMECRSSIADGNQFVSWLDPCRKRMLSLVRLNPSRTLSY